MKGNLFLAIDLREDDRHAIAHRLSELDLSKRVPGRRVKPQNWHITLCFIGEASQVDQDRLAERVEANLDVSSFSVKVGGINGFPRASKASVVYLAIDDRVGDLSVLSSICTDAAIDVGFDPDARRFVPHLTLSRVRPPQAIARLVDIAPLDVGLKVDAVTMFRTVPDRDGVTYEPVHRFELAP